MILLNFAAMFLMVLCSFYKSNNKYYNGLRITNTKITAS
jgi:hypothetical protein